jgi:uncharacterized protein YgiM (DUF1202 family)
MSVVIKERMGLLFFILFTAVVWFKASTFNDNSFEDASSIIYAIRTDVGNMREGPGKYYKVVKKLNEGAVFRAKKIEGSWVRGSYDFIDGWVHRSILGKHLYLEYYNEKVVGESVFELVWGN